jgi:hypothetical protein
MAKLMDGLATEREPVKNLRGHGSLERVTVNLSARASQALQETAELTGETKTESINRALQVYAYLRQVMADGGVVYTKNSDRADELERLRFFF